jgi:hypothetical protein
MRSISQESRHLSPTFSDSATAANGTRLCLLNGQHGKCSIRRPSTSTVRVLALILLSCSRHMTTTALQTFVERSDWHRRVSAQQRNSLPFNFLATTTTTTPIATTTQLHSARNRGGLEQRREGATPQGSNALFICSVLARPSLKWLLSSYGYRISLCLALSQREV